MKLESLVDKEEQELKAAIVLFQELLMECEAVVCARSSPKQKAKLVRFVRSRNKIVLSVGDGANDVNMLTVAYKQPHP